MYCIHCEVEFNPRSQRKRKVGGRINECADCVEELGTETTVKYLGCASADGKMGGVSSLALSRMKTERSIVRRGITTPE